MTRRKHFVRFATVLPVCSIAMLLVLAAACTAFRPVAGPPERIQRSIAADALLAPGDRVRLGTSDGNVLEFRVATVDLGRGTVTGKRDGVPIGKIVTLEKRELSWVKTGVLIGLLTLGVFGSDCEDDPTCDQFPEYGGFCC